MPRAELVFGFRYFFVLKYRTVGKGSKVKTAHPRAQILSPVTPQKTQAHIGHHASVYAVLAEARGAAQRRKGAPQRRKSAADIDEINADFDDSRGPGNRGNQRPFALHSIAISPYGTGGSEGQSSASPARGTCRDVPSIH